MMVHYLTKEDIVFINQKTIQAHGGNYSGESNFLHEENLDYLVETVQSEMFGQELYPLISDKASLYCFNIISNHIFTDGNKRTGLEAALAFLKFNRLRISKEITNETLIEFIIKIASGQSSLEECQAWFLANTIPI